MENLIEDIDVFDHSNHETSLWRNDENLTEFPLDVLELVHITCLGLYCNRLSSLPFDICCLVNLSSLHLDCNLFITVPSALYNLQSLQFLSMIDNHLSVNGEIDLSRIGISNSLQLQHRLEGLSTFWLTFYKVKLIRIPLRTIYEKEIWLLISYLIFN
jgi:Leucine-rich repeat (LRR) protein